MPDRAVCTMAPLFAVVEHVACLFMPLEVSTTHITVLTASSSKDLMFMNDSAAGCLSIDNQEHKIHKMNEVTFKDI